MVGQPSSVALENDACKTLAGHERNHGDEFSNGFCHPAVGITGDKTGSTESVFGCHSGRTFSEKFQQIHPVSISGRQIFPGNKSGIRAISRISPGFLPDKIHFSGRAGAPNLTSSHVL
jgi:hypothetical protein